jgi:hypothetical protein
MKIGITMFATDYVIPPREPSLTRHWSTDPATAAVSKGDHQLSAYLGCPLPL